MKESRFLKIAQVAPLIEPVPPKKYGGTERVVSALTEELVNRGHKVTLFASGDSKTSAKLVSVYPRSLREAKIKDLYGVNDLALLNTGIVYKNQDEYDIIHDHNSPLSLPIANNSNIPVVITIHGAFTATSRLLYSAFNNPKFICISKSQASSGRNIEIEDVIYNGLKMENYPFSRESGGYMLFVGRISMEKGVHHAIEVSQILNIPLIIAAKLDVRDIQYFKEYIEPALSEGYIKWIGEVDEEERNRLMSKAVCMLHPVIWREPFGLTMIEAMACGCPVIGFNKGSIPEIIDHGKTGFVVNDIDEMIDSVLNIGSIDRAECRKHVLKNFNVAKMADKYEEIYFRILEKGEVVSSRADSIQ